MDLPGTEMLTVAGIVVAIFLLEGASSIRRSRGVDLVKAAGAKAGQPVRRL
jgi:hypothetical protein